MIHEFCRTCGASIPGRPGEGHGFCCIGYMNETIETLKAQLASRAGAAPNHPAQAGEQGARPQSEA